MERVPIVLMIPLGRCAELSALTNAPILMSHEYDQVCRNGTFGMDKRSRHDTFHGSIGRTATSEEIFLRHE